MGGCKDEYSLRIGIEKGREEGKKRRKKRWIAGMVKTGRAEGEAKLVSK